MSKQTQRLPYTRLSPDGVAAMRTTEHYLNADSGLDKTLLEMVRLRASQLNGCDFCLGLHAHELARQGEPESRIAAVSSWRGHDALTDREQAALRWTEALTNLQEGHASDEEFVAVQPHFSEKELVDLTLAIASINAWNRVGVAFRPQWNPARAAPHTTARADRPETERASAMSRSPFQDDADRSIVLRAENLGKWYPSTGGAATAQIDLFRGLDLEVHAGEMVAIVGESGAGKSTLLHLLAGLDRPSAGEVWCGSVRLQELSSTRAAGFRNREIGYVWQFHHLLPEFTALENVAMPLLARGTPRPQAYAQASRWLGFVGLTQRAGHRSGEMSGGEQQRVSLARALVTEPRILLADEPTGDLDERTAESVFSLIQHLHRQHALASVLVTHHLGFARRCDRLLRLRQGRLQESRE